MTKHGYLEQLPLYRMNLDNINPYLGRFLYAPQYVYLKMKNGQITELKTLRTPGEILNCRSFLEDLEATSEMPISRKIKIDSRRHIAAYAQCRNLMDDFDIDFDLTPDRSSPKSRTNFF